MPQVVSRRGPGVALDGPLTEQPVPSFCKFKQQPSREYRASIHDHNNGILGQSVVQNDNHDRHWQGNGFPGFVQFVPYIGREPLRPGVKLERDIQVSTLPNENFKALNVTQMGRSRDSVLATGIPSRDEQRAHAEAVSTLRAHRSHAREGERFDNSHAWRRDEVEHSNLRQQRIAEQQRLLPGLRSAGLGSMNPRLGTCGSLPDLGKLRGSQGIEAWRLSTPWAIGGDDSR
mmetsp:Transcript_42274/g.120953  ORF Transcript_42274/g.120953 Transcript_42274/m.120953 type:complete len:231 (+) Transcript_42274:58-750(+)